MLNLYAVKVWHLSGPHHFETIEVRTYTARRAEELASESFPGCIAAARRMTNLPRKADAVAALEAIIAWR